MINYVVGFAFSRNKKDIVLIEKQKPEWQKGKFNGVGGKVDTEDVSPMAAMIREFKEETGVTIAEAETRAAVHGGNYADGWHHFATLIFEECNLYCFRAYTNSIYQCGTIEEEKIQVTGVYEALSMLPIIPNLKVLIPMALDEDFVFSEINAVIR